MNLQQKTQMWRFALNLAQLGHAFILPDDDPHYADINPDKWCLVHFGEGSDLHTDMSPEFTETRWGTFEHPEGIGIWVRDLDDAKMLEIEWSRAEKLV